MLILVALALGAVLACVWDDIERRRINRFNWQVWQNWQIHHLNEEIRRLRKRP